MYSKIIVPLDGSEFSERVLPHVEALAEKFNSVLVLVRCVPTEAILAGQSMAVMPLAGGMPVDRQFTELAATVEAEEKKADCYLCDVAARLREKGIRIEYAEPEGRPAESIVEVANEQHADLIAMTTHGRGGLSRLFVGSVADEVLRISHCPVLLVKVTEILNGHQFTNN